MTDRNTNRVYGTAWLVVGLLWFAFTGLCTWSGSRDGEFGELVVAIGTFIIAIGFVPLSLGVERLLQTRTAGRVLIVAGATWAIGSAIELILLFHGATLRDIPAAAIPAGVFMVPGVLVALRGLAILRRAR